MTDETKLIKVNGISLEAKWVNARSHQNDRVMVFLHEGLGCVSMWRDFPQNLSNRTGLSSFVYSRQGYGKSDPVPLPRNLDFMHAEGLDVLPNILDVEGINRAILVGHSDGASIALINAGGARDSRIEALVLLAAHVFNEDITVKSIKEAKKAFKIRDLREKLAKYHGTNVDCAFWGWNDIWLAPEFKEWNIESYLANIILPSLVVQGEDDQYGTSAQVNAIQTGIGPEAKVKIIPNCGHSPQIEQKDITLEVIARFIETLSNNK